MNQLPFMGAVRFLAAMGLSIMQSLASATPTQDPDELKAVRYLEAIQSAIHAKLGTRPAVRHDEAWLDEMLKKYFAVRPTMTADQREEFSRRYKQHEQAPLPSRVSRYESVTNFSMLDSLDQQIQAVLARSSAANIARPVFGTLPTRHVNARTFLVPGTSRNLIAFEDQLWGFTNLVSKAIVLALPPLPASKEGKVHFSIDIDKVVRHLETTPEAEQRFQELMVAYIAQGRPTAAPQYFAQELPSQLVQILLSSMELFVLGHEYGHVIAHHGRSRTITQTIGNQDFEEVWRDWEAEFVADAIGLKLSVAAMRTQGFDVAMSYWGADLFATAMDIVERALGVLSEGREPTDDELLAVKRSHPPWWLRRESLRKFAVEFYGEQGKSAAHLGEQTQQVAQQLWARTRPVLQAMHKSGLRPHPSWQIESKAPPAGTP